MCTDGLLETRGSGLEVGERRVADLLGTGPDDLAELAEYITAAVAAGRVQEDDVALLLAALPNDRG